MKRRYSCIAIASTWLLLSLSGLASDAITLSSPDGNVQFRLLLQEGLRLGYAVAFKGKSVIETSPLGIVVDGANLGEGVEAGKGQRYRVRQTYDTRRTPKPFWRIPARA